MFFPFRQKTNVSGNRRHEYSFKDKTDWFSTWNMQIEHGYQSPLRFWFFKVGKKNLYFRRKFLNLQKWNICITALAGEYAYNIPSRYLEKRLSFLVLNAQKGHFLRYFRGFWHFSYFHVLSILVLQKVFEVFFCSWGNSDPKQYIKPPKLKILILTFWPCDLG